MTGSTAFNNAAPTGFTTTAGGGGNGTISLTSASAKTFVGGGSTYAAKLDQGGAGNLTVTGSNTLAGASNSYTAAASSVLFTAGTTTTFTVAPIWLGSSGKLVTIDSVTASTHTLTIPATTVSNDYVSIAHSTAAGSGSAWYAGANSTNGGSNSGWIFTAPPAGGVSNQTILMRGAANDNPPALRNAA